MVFDVPFITSLNMGHPYSAIVSAWVVIPLRKPQPSNFSVLQAVKNLTSPPRQAKSPDNFNVLHMFNNNTFTDSRTACKHILIPIYVIQMI